MAARRDLGTRDAADAVQDAEGELDVARQVFNTYALLTHLTPVQRLVRAAGLLGMPLARVRRYVALHLAPEDIRQLFAQGELTARVVEALSGLKTENQRIVARQVQANTHPTLSQTVLAHRVDQSANRTWSESAQQFERHLLDACNFLNPYLDAPRAVLVNTFRGAGGAVGRRTLIELIDRQMSLLSTLKETLERVDGVAEGERPVAHGATAVANSS